MKATRILHDLGQSIWLDNITRNVAGLKTSAPVPPAGFSLSCSRLLPVA
jgi:hypothetical protein